MVVTINEKCWPKDRASTWKDHCWHSADAYESYSDGLFCCRCPAGMFYENRKIELEEKTHGLAMLCGRDRAGMTADTNAVNTVRKYAMEKNWPWACQCGCGDLAEDDTTYWCSAPRYDHQPYVVILPPTKD